MCDGQHERDKKVISGLKAIDLHSKYFLYLRNGYSDDAHLKLLCSPFALGLQSFSNTISGEIINFANRLTEPLVHC